MNDMRPIETLSDAEFSQVAQIAAEDAGIAIPPSKKSLVYSRVTRRMRALGIDTTQYFERLESDVTERQELICVLTTNVSHFYREQHHFHYIRDKLLPNLSRRNLRFWSAGCSNGQEPYTLAFELLQAIPDAAKRDILILATDIDQNVIKKAKSGIYTSGEIEGVPAAIRNKVFSNEAQGTFKVRREFTDIVRFRTLNLNSDWPMQGRFDLIMCRNVVIYFNDETQRMLWPRFAKILSPAGILMIGHSERIHPLENSGFEPIDVTTYRKI